MSSEKTCVKCRVTLLDQYNSKLTCVFDTLDAEEVGRELGAFLNNFARAVVARVNQGKDIDNSLFEVDELEVVTMRPDDEPF